MRPRFLAAGLLALLVALALTALPRGPLVASDAADAAAIRNAIQETLSDANLPSAFWGVYVRNLRTGEVVYSRNADMNLIPASNLKLLTTAVALDALGPNFRYATRLYFDGEARDSTLRGDLVLRGSADPTFGSALYGGGLEAWARDLRALGVARIEGRLIGDDDRIDDLPYADGWDISHIATEDWAQSVGGLSYADNLVQLQIAGTRPGEPASVEPVPGGYVRVKNDLTTRGRRGYNPIRIRRTVGTNEIVVEGAVSAGYRGTARVPIQDPTAFTLHAFVEALEAAGIRTDLEVIDADDLEEDVTYGEDAPLLVHLSPPLIEILTAVNEKSNNFFAEQVFRTFAPGGTTAGGERRVFEFLEAAGIPTQGLSIRDGSGLSRKNLVSPETLGRLLAHMYTHDLRDAFLRTLPQGGQEGTTLRYRLAGLPVFAKTGSLEHVRALSGYVAGPDDTPYAFVLFANNYTSKSSLVAVAQNEIAQAIARGGV